jgi:hypothetical protein
MKNINFISFFILFSFFSALNPAFFRPLFRRVPKNLGEVLDFMITDFGRTSFYEDKGSKVLGLKEDPILYFMRKVGMLPGLDKSETYRNRARSTALSYFNKIR